MQKWKKSVRAIPNILKPKGFTNIPGSPFWILQHRVALVNLGTSEPEIFMKPWYGERGFGRKGIAPESSTITLLQAGISQNKVRKDLF